MFCNPKTFQKDVKRKRTVTWEPVTKPSILEGQGGQHCLIPFEAFFTECLHQGKYDTSPVICEKCWQKRGEGERMREKECETSFNIFSQRGHMLVSESDVPACKIKRLRFGNEKKQCLMIWAGTQHVFQTVLCEIIRSPNVFTPLFRWNLTAFQIVGHP